MAQIHVATVPPDLDLALLDKLLSSIESTLVQFGAVRVWVDADRPPLAIMCDLPDSVVQARQLVEPRAARSC